MTENHINAWKKTAPGEALEEAIQDNITSFVKKFTYKNNSEWFSLTNDDAVINPARTANAAKAGYLFGGTFGTGNTFVKSVRADIKNAPDADGKRVKRDFGESETISQNEDFEATTAKNKETESERVAKRIEEVYNEVKEMPDEEMNAKPSKYSYMDKTLPSGKTLKQLAKAVAKEGIVSGVVTGLVYAANGDDFKDGFVNGMVSGTLSGGISGTFDNYIMMAVGEIAGEAVGYLTESYISDSKDTTNKERIYKVAENVVLAIFKSFPKAAIRYAIILADAEKSVTKQLMKYDENFGEYLELFWDQVIDVMYQWGVE